MEMLQRSGRLSSRLVIVVASLGILVSPLLAKGKLDTVATFKQAKSSVVVETYTDPDLKPSKVGLLALVAASGTNAITFRSEEWPKLIALVAKAARTQSAGTSWTVIGALTETGTSDAAHLVVSAGTGIRFALSSPKNAGLTHVLADSDVPRFQQALERVKEYLAAP